MKIKYEVEFLDSGAVLQYGRHFGVIRGARLKEPYAEVRKALAAWRRDTAEMRGTSPTDGVTKFQFHSLVVDGQQLMDMERPVVCCLCDAERSPEGIATDGGRWCSRCGTAIPVLSGWNG